MQDYPMYVMKDSQQHLMYYHFVVLQSNAMSPSPCCSVKLVPPSNHFLVLFKQGVTSCLCQFARWVEGKFGRTERKSYLVKVLARLVVLD